MDPICFSLGSLTIRWYGVMAAVGFICAVTLARWNAPKAGLKDEHALDLGMISIIGGLLGARLFYVIQFWSEDGFDRHFLSVFRLDRGGLVFYGGFLTVLAGFFVYARYRKIPYLKTLDLYAPSIAVAHLFGRIGCFINGCCYGKACDLPWGFTYPPDVYRLPAALSGVPLHPIQLYEALGNAAICAITILAVRRWAAPGRTAGLYLVLYGVLRFFDEFLRGDHTDFDPIFRRFTEAQSICLLIILPVGVWLLIRKIRPLPPPEKKAPERS